MEIYWFDWWFWLFFLLFFFYWKAWIILLVNSSYESCMQPVGIYSPESDLISHWSVSWFRPEKTSIRPSSSLWEIAERPEARGISHDRKTFNRKRHVHALLCKQPDRLRNVWPARVNPLTAHQAHSRGCVCLIELTPVTPVNVNVWHQQGLNRSEALWRELVRLLNNSQANNAIRNANDQARISADKP